MKPTVLAQSHQALGARMAPFAGYSMPIQYADGILAEHRWTRASAGLFDVSHMGPAFLEVTARTGDGEANHAAIAAVIEPLISGDIAGLKPGRLRYTLMLNKDGGILDDLMVGRPRSPDRQGLLYVVVNAGTKEADFAALAAEAGDRARLTRADDRALIALQGPKAGDALAEILPATADLAFMDFDRMTFAGHSLIVSRSGYTGEDGFEILAPSMVATRLWDRLAGDARVKPAGLGARDSLRLEAGLPLYGHDMDETVSPFEAGLGFAVSPRRLKAGRIRGADRLAAEQAGGAARERIGLTVLEGAPAREGASVIDAAGAPVGKVTSGGFSPTLGAPIAMAMVPPKLVAAGSEMRVVVRGKPQPARVTSLPFVPHRYRRPPARKG
ncbi:MAG: glycine cleavage system aminomethyltransferase GcvT [Caulobacteraceae bacterium]